MANAPGFLTIKWFLRSWRRFGEDPVRDSCILVSNPKSYGVERWRELLAATWETHLLTAVLAEP